MLLFPELYCRKIQSCLVDLLSFLNYLGEEQQLSYMGRIRGTHSFSIGSKMAWLKDAILKLVLICAGEQLTSYYTSISSFIHTCRNVIFYNGAGITIYNSLWTANWSGKELDSANEYAIHSEALLGNTKLNEIIEELKETRLKLNMLEEKYKSISNRGVKTYPDVKYKNYRNKKRILVGEIFLNRGPNSTATCYSLLDSFNIISVVD